MMMGEEAIALRMEAIKNLAIHAQFISAISDDLEVIIQEIEKADSEYRLVAYEGVSMMLAKKDFYEGNGLSRWNAFLERIDACYLDHAYIGLGWAVAKTKNFSSSILRGIQDSMMHRVLDGRGYFDGIFQPRQSWMLKQHPPDIDETRVSAYYQGIGRSLLYHCLGSPEKVAAIIIGFPPERQQDLWRGVGIAVLVVGGFNKEMLDYTRKIAFPNHLQLAVGAVIAAKGRVQLKAMTHSCLLVSETWCQRSPQDCFFLVKKIEKDIPPEADFFQSLISGILHELSKAPVSRNLWEMNGFKAGR